jgi:ribosomal protein L37AE/L43A
MTESGTCGDGIDWTCPDCNIVIYDVSYSDSTGPGYLNPEYCPQCGQKLADGAQDDDREEPTRSEPADFGYGDSTGVQDL